MSEERLLKLVGSKTSLQLERSVRQGLTYKTIDSLVHSNQLTPTEVSEFIPARTLARRKREGRLSANESDIIARLARLIAHTEEVFGNKEKAHIWLRTPNRALEGERPLNLLHSDIGCRLVEGVLGRIEHGVHS